MPEAVIERNLRHPVSTVFEAFTNPEMLKKWLPPDHFTCSEVVFESRVGGAVKVVFQDKDGNEAVALGEVTEFQPDGLYEYVASTRYLGTINENIRTRIEFEAIPDGTALRVRVFSEDPEFAKNCTVGWNQSLDNFESVIA
ncbi:MAG: SRPBCC domain-containing protein [Armatimonadetes bacterium]|nr:SRPBCC domain-containing protein [Armatimonadota bacterium]